MAVAELVGDGRVAVQTDFPDKDLIRAVPGALWDPGAKMWHVPQSWGACLALRGMFGQRLTIGPALNAWLWQLRQERIDPALQLRNVTELPAYDACDVGLLPFQVPGHRFMTLGLSALLGDEMGSGKTIQLVRALRRLRELGHGPYPALVIAPNSAKRQWERFIRNWEYPNIRIHVISGSKAKRTKVLASAAENIALGYDVIVVVNWEAVRLHSRLAPYGSTRLQTCSDCDKTSKRKPDTCHRCPKELNSLGFRTVIADEAHKMKDPTSQQTRAVWAVQHGPTVVWRWAATGTPIANHPGDLWAILHGIAPRDFPTRGAYVDRYCLQSWSPFGGLEIIGIRPDTRDEFFAIFDPMFRRMPKSVVLPYLPKKVRAVRNPEMTPKQAKAYADIEEGMVTRLDDGSIVMASNNLTANTRLLQFSSAYATVNEEGNVRLADPSNKIDDLIEFLGEIGDEPMVVVAEHRQLIELTCERLDKENISWRRIIGGMNDAMRDQAVQDFHGGLARVFLFTIKAGGTGLDGLQTRSGIIGFLQRSWSMLENKQTEDRIHRIGSEVHDKILIVDFVSPGTIEEDQVESLHAKLARLEEIVRDRDTARLAGDLERVQHLEQEAAWLEQTPLVPVAA